MKRRLWQFLVCILLSLTMAFAFAACGGDEGGEVPGGTDVEKPGEEKPGEEKPSEENPGEENPGDGDEKDETTALSVPANVKVEGDVLSWTAVEHASGYVVKINSDETTTVTAASLDLTTVTAKLTEGENTLSVKAKGAGNYTDSGYSSAVKYTYTVPDETPEAVKAFVAKVGAIETLAQTHTQAQATAIDTAIKEAETAYAALTEEEKPYAATAYAELTAKKHAHAEQTAAAKTAHDAYAALIAAAEEKAEAEQSAAELQTAVEAVKTAKGQLSTLASGLVTEEEENRRTGLETTLSAWNAKITEAMTALGADLPALDPANDATAEEILPAVAELLKTYETFEAYVKADDRVEAKRASLAALQAFAKGQIETAVETLKTDLADALEHHSDATKENYQLLLALEARISSLGEYAKTLFNVEENGKKLTAAKEAMMDEVVAVEKNEKVLYNSDKPNEQPVFALVLKYENVAGKALELEEVPTISISEQVGEGEKTLLTPSEVTYDETKGVYVVTASFTNAFKENKAVTLTYTVNDPLNEGAKTLALGASGEIVYFTNSTSEAYVNNKLTLYGGTEFQDTIIEAYLAEDIVKANGNDSIEIKGLPFASGTKAQFDNPESLRYFAAKAGLTGKVSVVLLAYQRWEEEGKIRVSAINSASVSVPIELEGVDADDAKERLPMPKFNGAVELNIQEAVNDGTLAALLGLESLTRVEASELVCLHLEVIHNGETKDYYEPLSSNYVHSKILEEGTMVQLLFDLFGDLEGEGYEVTIRLVFVEGSPYADKIGESYPIYYTYEGAIGGGKLVPDLNQGAWSLDDGNGNIDFKQQAVTTDGIFHDGALIYIYDTNGIDAPLTHDFSQETPYAVYHIKSQAAVSWKKSNANNSSLGETIRLAWIAQLKEAGTPLAEIEYPTYHFVFAMQLIANEKGNKFGYTDSDLVYATKNGARDVMEYTFTQDDVKAPNYAQFNFADNSTNVEYLKPTEGLGRGEIFSVEKAAYIELEFSKDGQAYSVFLFEEEGKVVIYKDKNKSGDSLATNDGVNNAWGSAQALSDKIKEWYGLDSMDIRDGWTYRTKVYIDGDSLYYVDGDWSEGVVSTLPQAPQES